jgi:phage gpG-like protein
MTLQINCVATGPFAEVRQAFIGARLDAKIQQFLKMEAEIVRGKIITSFPKQGLNTPWKKLSKWTLAFRKFKGFGGTKALIHTGELRKSVVTQYEKNHAFVGVLYSARSTTGKSLVNIARVQEYGATIIIKITPKMRKFLAMVARFAGFSKTKTGGGGSSGGRTFMIVVIPPRPFMEPARYAWLSGLNQRIAQVFSNWEL